MKLKKGDEIIVTIGKDKGHKGKIDTLFPKKDKVKVPGINMYKKHMKRRDDKNPGGIYDIPRPIHVAKIALVCPSCKKPTRIGYLVTKTGKERICKKCGKKV
jgi:large subunit ribosomal protein L24